MGMLRVYPVADHEEGLWSAARDDHGARPRPQKKATAESRWLIKYVDMRTSAVTAFVRAVVLHDDKANEGTPGSCCGGSAACCNGGLQ